MSGGLESTVNSCGAKTTEFFLGDGEGAEKLREQGYEFGHRVFSLYSVRLELNRPPNSDSKGEWVTLIGPRENLEKAKDFVLSSFMPRCRLELASTHHTTSEPPSSSPSMAQNSYYDRASLHSHSSPSYSQNVSPPATISSYQSSLSHDNHRPCHGHAPSPYPPSVETRSRVEPTPTISTIESNEQLHNAFLQIPLEQLKDLHVLLDVALKRQSLANPSQPPRGGGGGVDGRGHRLLSRSPDPREEKIDYFVNRLNYPRAKVESVIDQLGPDASIDDILGRLMRICPNDVKAPPIAGSNGGSSSSSGGGGVYKQHRYSGNLGGLGGGESLSPPSQFSPPLPMPGNALSLPQPPVQDPSRLRHIVIDGSNVAMRHGSGQFYSCRGIQLAVDYFRKRGHDKITVFVPEWRKEASKPETPITEQEILHILDKEGVVKFTPSRRIRGRRVACYDDRFILDLATHEDGVIVSNDQFRDLMDDKPEWREVIETKLLPFQFVNDYFMPADDPMGKDGPTLNQLLVKDPRDVPGRQKPMHTSSTKVCPYLEKCTFGRKCKFYHPEREPRNEVALAMTANVPQNSTSPVGSRTPNTSRSATPSPSPDKRHSRYSNSNRSSGEDLRQLHSKNGSTDDLSSYHQMSSATTMDITELQRLMQNARLHDVPGQSTANVAGNQSCYYDPRQRPHPPHSMNLPPASIHSAPVFSNNADSAASTPSEPHHPHRYTFPMAVVHQPHHVNSRTHIMTEQHRIQSQGVGGAGGVSQALGIPPLAPELDPNVMFQPHHQYSGGLSGYHQSSLLPQEAPPPPPHQSTNHASLQGVSSQSMFVTRDSRLPSSAHYPPAPHDLHGGSLMQAPPGFYPSSAQTQQPNGPLGYNSRGVAASGTADSNHHNPHSHSMGSSVSVPSTHSSPYHEMGGHLQHRHHSVDYGNPQNISPHRRRSSFNEGQKVNGHIPQASTTSGYGGSPYYNDYNQQQLPQQSTTTGAHTRPYLNHQSTVFTQSSQVSSQQHYHRLPAVNERPYENGAIVEPSLAKPSLFRKVVAVFPGCEEIARSVMIANPHVSDFEELVRLVQQRLVTSH